MFRFPTMKRLIVQLGVPVSIWISKKKASSLSRRRLGQRRLRFGTMRTDKRIAFASAVAQPKEFSDGVVLMGSLSWKSDTEFEQGDIDLSSIFRN